MAAIDVTEEPGLRAIEEFADIHDIWPRGPRLEAVRSAARAYRERFKAQGEVRAVKSQDIAAASYPTRFAFHGAAIAPTPFVAIVNRMVLVQYEDWGGVRRTLVWEPTVPEGTNEAPFYAQLEQRVNRIPGGHWMAHNLFTRYYNDVHQALAKCGLRPEGIDYVSFDHLHVQDPRMIMGSSERIEGEDAARPPLFPNAKMIVQRKELGTFEGMHPMQWAWYVDGGMDGVPAERLVVIDGDVELGPGISIIWTPGHTDGNQSLCLNTPDGVWVSSENGVAVDNWQPELSKIPGVKAYGEFFGREIVPNANTLEDSLDQYDSMVKEKTLADRSARDPRWLQILPSSELASWRRQWPVMPSFAHGGIEYGTLLRSSSPTL